MTQAAAPQPPAPERWADPFGLWQPMVPRQPMAPRQPAAVVQPVAFGVEPEPLPSEAPAAVWTVAADQPGALAQRARQVRAVEDQLGNAEQRFEVFLRQWEAGGGGTAGGSGASFSAGAGEGLSEPEQRLAQGLSALAAHPAASYGLPGGANLDELRARFEDWLERANHQLLHYVWVDTLVEGRLAARTQVAWTGGVSTTCTRALDPALLAAHGQSFGLAMVSRTSTLRTVVMAARMAAKLSLLIATPLGQIQALLLAAQFLRDIFSEALPSG